jgi:MFS family permease
MLRIFGTFITPFAVALKATTAQVGLLSALPNLMGSVGQLSTPYLIQRLGSRKRLFMLALPLSGLVWIPIALLPWFPGMTGMAKVWWLLGFASLVLTLYMLPAPAWGSWVSQLLPVERRGRFLGARGTLAALISVVAVLAMGYFLDLMESKLFLGFSVIFFGAALMRVFCTLLLQPAFEPPLTAKKAAPGGMKFFLKELMSSNLGHWLAINALFQFAVCLAGPFFVVLMLNDLHFSYTTIILLQLVNTLAAMIGMQVWGLMADKRGNLLVLRLSAPLIGVMTFGWVANQSVWWLAGVEVLGGFAWAGYNLSAVNFVYESSTDRQRALNVGFFNAFAGVGIFVGSIVGGLLAPIVPHILEYSLLTLILISAIVRMSIALFLVPRVREIRREHDRERVMA